ncbi:hypothetical protein F9L33_00360 [Amylibacter sp. SFDW26]|uniref:hypothetical protein n=1 Tax=Amylibacter sp. SFDW26 TaxID=2652722 RepID=UPI0012619F25|nr:hypothetical protein [Amylibacter sp. SFDW26]KAB7615257.1 hypothetical protein F9L33_00360 [Amylibacter sp. SFDW26]
MSDDQEKSKDTAGNSLFILGLMISIPSLVCYFFPSLLSSTGAGAPDSMAQTFFFYVVYVFFPIWVVTMVWLYRIGELSIGKNYKK